MCADGHSYEKDFIQKWLARLDTNLVAHQVHPKNVAFALIIRRILAFYPCAHFEVGEALQPKDQHEPASYDTHTQRQLTQHHPVHQGANAGHPVRAD